MLRGKGHCRARHQGSRGERATESLVFEESSSCRSPRWGVRRRRCTATPTAHRDKRRYAAALSEFEPPFLKRGAASWLTARFRLRIPGRERNRSQTCVLIRLKHDKRRTRGAASAARSRR